MDEPFGALDPLTRADLQREFLGLQKNLNKAVLFVTHDLHEALLLGTRIALLDDGRLISCTSPAEFVASQQPIARRYMEAFNSEDKLDRGPA
jgi:osmoprotectant transport system ATP-binding protein